MIKKIFVLIIFVLFQTNINASSFKPIIEGREDAKIKLIIYESLTCSFCADFHNKVYPELKKEFTIIIVTHSMQQAARVSTNTGFFHLGKLIEVDSTDTIFSNPGNQKTQDYITGRFG